MIEHNCDDHEVLLKSYTKLTKDLEKYPTMHRDLAQEFIKQHKKKFDDFKECLINDGSDDMIPKLDHSLSVVYEEVLRKCNCHHESKS